MLERDIILIAFTSTATDHRMEGGLQQGETTFIIGQYYTQRIHQENGIAKTACIRPNTNRRILQMSGGELGLRSVP